jgi:hypothetical protein
MNKEELIMFINNNIEGVRYTEDIISYITLKGISCSENHNGIFLNISLLDVETLTKLYEFINSDLTKSELKDKYIFNEINEIKETNKSQHIYEPIKYKDIVLTPLQVYLLTFSK